ncbi:hypothetical protein GGS24DRAFT_468601 [Hypoxylon argillaceum]|nr:hypothetical protein GGS24DRAFT_468601 [Hypoxylon argillaceum]
MADLSSPIKKFKSNVKSRDYLQRLETPVYIIPWIDGELQKGSSFQDVKHLCDMIFLKQWKRGVVPLEIQEQFTAIYLETFSSEPFPECFGIAACSSLEDGDVRDDDGFTATERARVELALLRRVHRQASLSKTYQRNECGWTAKVYNPLLEHVFKGDVRPEAVMTATMQGDSIPRQVSVKVDAGKSNDQLDGIDTLSDFCVTITASSTSSASSARRANGGQSRNLAHIQSRDDVKIVDYVLVLDLPKNSALQETISTLITQVSEGGGRRHVNQTAYPSIEDSVVAVSIAIQTELSAIDPLLQLGVWAAAWYKRMWFLRRELFATKVADIQDEQLLLHLRQQEQQKRLITVPLLTVVGHQWDMYFAVFDTASIKIHGPMKLGNTDTLLDVYSLVGSLRAVEEWIRTTFKAAMDSWFIH